MSGNQQKDARRRRFSIICCTAVLVILSGTCQSLNIGDNKLEGKKRITRIQLKELEGALQLFYFDTGRYPTSSEGLDALVRNPRNLDKWKGPYLNREMPRDPWDKPYIYRFPGRHGYFDLLSCGPDGVEGSADDIVN